MVVLLLADREMEPLGTNSIRRLADLGVTRVGVFRDGPGVAIGSRGGRTTPPGPLTPRSMLSQPTQRR
jgi:hypothetical protein